MFTVTVTARADTRTPEVPGGGAKRHGGGGRGKERAMRSPGRRRRRAPPGGGPGRRTITLVLLGLFLALLALARVGVDRGAQIKHAENPHPVPPGAGPAAGGGGGP